MEDAVLTVVELGNDVADVYAWVDANTRGGALESDSAGVSERLLPQLHVLSQELSATLQQQLESFPSFDTHVQLLAIKAQGLLLNLQNVADATSPIPDGTDASPTTSTSVANPSLIVLHEAKQHMQACIHALEESAAWTQHSRLVAQIVSDSVASAAVSPTLLPSLVMHLTALNKSLRILAPMPGAPDRQATMTRLQGQVESLVLPALVEQLEQPRGVDVDKVGEFVAIFDCLGRPDVVRQRFASARPAPIHRLWLSMQTGPMPLNLGDFYADVEAFFAREWRTISQVFGPEAAPNVWLALLEATLQPCTLSAFVHLDTVSPWFSLSCQFAHTLLTNYGGVSDSISSIMAPAILRVVFAPYWPLFKSYTETETRHVLAPQLRDVVPTVVDADFAAQLEEAATLLWSAAEARMSFGFSFAHGGLLPGTVAAITTTIQAFEAALVALKRDLEQKLLRTSGNLTSHAMDWEAFHIALHLVKTTGLLLTQAEAFQTRWGARVQGSLSAWMGEGTQGPPPAWSLDECREVATLPKAVMAQWWANDAGSYHDLTCLVHSLTFKPLFGHVFATWTSTVQELLCDSVLGPIHAMLRPLPSLEIWIQPEATDALPSFNTLPQEYMTAVADILLSLLPQLELFAATSGLAHAVAASRNVHLLSHAAWAKVATALRVDIPSDLSDLTQESFVDRWTMVFASGAMAILAGQVFQIPRFSKSGAAQLACDLSYLQNVCLALGVPLHPALHHLHHKMLGQDACDATACTLTDARVRDHLNGLLSVT
ncbi:hypothetical protein H310_14477 [Aphanomyces invadans]|uniref:Conserved oligomeric Golgi complex subunit 7 n=1 Tax=Aphanomyces invadans TaxID=157072 RepID=A0A024T9J3_9STRA|nr:hypothetical protein H310_14477 [Aphanomyces invadans]ETV90810.1 hypothetical protein H310_14477 [Aphanomyces invadans]|eukprot:XP_008880567.1 hypothetical protein H310_14477 [Aphanomyces invadans]